MNFKLHVCPTSVGIHCRKILARISNIQLSLTLLLCLGFAAGKVYAENVTAAKKLTYPIVDTGQDHCFSDNRQISYPKTGEAFYGQDAQFQGRPASYTISADGLTVHDNNTGLTWQRSPDTNGDGAVAFNDKLTLAQAQAFPVKLNSAKFAGYSDWRLPTIKELYSLFDARGLDPSGNSGTDTSGLKPFIDTKFFKFAYGDTNSGERIIDSQWATCTVYVANQKQMFGVNFADGRIKGYGTGMPGRPEKTFFVICVRGNPDYGKNDFHDNGDGTIDDRATGLMWAKTDSGRGMNWQEALAWVQKKNADKFLGHDDWRLPNVKELQSIVDYSRSPDTTKSAAINPVFECSKIKNEAGQDDFPFYWTSTTHGGFKGGEAAMYIAFGRASGWMPARQPSGTSSHARPAATAPQGDSQTEEYRFTDVHGAGAQRSDPKSGNPAMFSHGRGPQGDVVRINNYVRCVRGGEAAARTGEPSIEEKASPASKTQIPVNSQSGTGLNEHFKRLDKNGDGKISRSEFDGPPEHFNTLDKNKDGYLSPDELPKAPPPRQTRN